jgi:O-antigen/teichoic acid export membrane protein
MAHGMSATQPVPEVMDASSETLLAVRNTLKLGGSLILTLVIGIAIRLVMPRYLGPASFGVLSFADAFTTTFFVALGLGIDVYVRKHVSVRPAHASDFFGGTLALRILMTGVVLGAMAIVMSATNRPAEVRHLVYIFAFAQFFVNVNVTLAAMLQGKGNVGAMSVLSIVTKVAWAGGVVVAMLMGGALWEFAAAFLLSEAIKCGGLFVLAQRHLGLIVRLDAAATKTMILASLPYYLANLATTVYGKLDLTLLTIYGASREVGWYAASSTIANLALLITPLIGWVLMPTFARAAARSRDELFARMRSATQLVLSVAIPISLFISVGADVWVRLLFGAAFAPAAMAVRILATTFVLMYVGIIYAITLMMLERAWALMVIAFGGLAVNVGLNLLLIRPAIATLGDGGGGVACSLSVLGTEIAVTSAMIAIVGRQAFDRRTVTSVLKTLGACALVIVTDRLAAPLGWPRLLVEGVLYMVVIVASGALQTEELFAIVRSALRLRAQRR